MLDVPVVSSESLILMDFRSIKAASGSVNVMIDPGPAVVAPLVSHLNLCRLKLERVAVENATDLGTTCIFLIVNQEKKIATLKKINK